MDFSTPSDQVAQLDLQYQDHPKIKINTISNGHDPFSHTTRRNTAVTFTYLFTLFTLLPNCTTVSFHTLLISRNIGIST